MDDTLAEFLAQEQAVAVRLYRFAKAVQAAFLDGGTAVELPPPCGMPPGGDSDAHKKIASQDPSLKALVKELLKPDQEGASNSLVAGGGQELALLHWWAVFGDFEISLQRRLAGASAEPQKRRLFSRARKAGTSARFFKDGRVALIRGAGTPALNSLHPIAWYVQCVSDPVWSSYVERGVVGEMLSLHGTGGWRTRQDVLVEFFDAVTRAASTRFVSSFATRGSHGDRPMSAGNFSKSIKRSAEILGLALEACEPCDVDGVLSPCGAWPEEAGKVRLREESRIAGRRILPISACARPRAYVRMAGDRPDWSSRVSTSMRQAVETWPDQEAFAKWLAGAMREPARCIEDALGAVGGFLVQSLDSSADGTGGFSEGRFVGELRRMLAKRGVAVVESESSARCVAARFSRAGRWALRIDGAPVTVPFGAVHKATCPDALFDAINRYDDYVWSCVTVAEVSRNPDWARAREHLLTSGAWGEQWEHVKVHLLDLPPDPTVEQIVVLCEASHRICVRLDGPPEQLEAGSSQSMVASGLIDEARRRLRAVVGSVLALAGEHGNDVRSGFYPPRHLEGHRAGDVNVGRWLDDPWWEGRKAARERCELTMRRSDSVGVEESITDVGRSLTLLVPFATEADEALGACRGIFVWSDECEPPAYVRTIHECLRHSVQAVVENGGKVDFAEGLVALRARFASKPDAGGFHEMIDLATQGDRMASACVSLLRSDKRFDFTCFPTISEANGRWEVKEPHPSDKELSWKFTEKTRGQTVEVKFATSEEGASRVISRGPAEGAGLQQLAAGIMEWCRPLPDLLRPRAREIMRCSDRHETFRESLDDGIKAAAAFLHVVAHAADEGAAVALTAVQRDEGFRRLKAWLHTAGAAVEPDEWSAAAGARSMPEGVEESLPEFNASIPEGSVVVKEFGIVVRDGGPRFGTFAGCRSAGQLPAKYHELVSLADIPGGELFLAWLRRLPEKKLKGRDAFRSDLYDLYYKISIGHYCRMKDKEPEWSLPTDLFAKAKQGLEEMYEAAFECTAFPKEQAVVRVFNEVGPDEVQLLEPGQPEGAVRVVVRGFKSKGKVVKARVLKEPAS